MNSDLKTDFYQGKVNTDKKNDDGVFTAHIDFATNIQNDWDINLRGKYTEQETFMRRYGFDDNDKYKSYINAKKVRPNKSNSLTKAIAKNSNK